MMMTEREVTTTEPITRVLPGNMFGCFCLKSEQAWDVLLKP